MKLQILSGALGLVLLLGLVPLQPAEAKIFLIDDFSSDPFPGLCDFPLSAGSTAVPQSAPSGVGINGVLGDWRICMLTIDVSNPPSLGEINVVGSPADGAAGTTAEMFRHMAGTGVETTVMLTYNGTDGTLATDVVGISLNLFNSDDLRIVYSTSDFSIDVIATLTDSDGDSASKMASTIAGTVSTPTEILYDLDDFVVVNPLLNLGAITEIKLTFDTTIAFTDYDLDLIDITMEMVGGEMFPVDTTALLLAGAELNAIWILPAIAAIGIGAFIVSRKRN